MATRTALTGAGTIGAGTAVFLAVFIALYLPASSALQGGGTAAVLALIVLQQLYVFARVWLRMMAWGAAVELDPL